MARHIRDSLLVAGVIVAAGLVAVILTVSSGTRATSGMDPKAPGDEFDADGRIHASLQRIAVKSRLVQAVVHDEMTLADAAACFLHLNRMDSGLLATLKRLYPETDELEWAYRNVLMFVRVELAEQPELAATVVPRVREEFRTQFPSHSTGWPFD